MFLIIIRFTAKLYISFRDLTLSYISFIVQGCTRMDQFHRIRVSQLLKILIAKQMPSIRGEDNNPQSLVRWSDLELKNDANILPSWWMMGRILLEVQIEEKLPKVSRIHGICIGVCSDVCSAADIELPIALNGIIHNFFKAWCLKLRTQNLVWTRAS